MPTPEEEEEITTLVRGGYRTVDEIVRIVLDAAGDEGTPSTPEELEAFTRAKVEERRQELPPERSSSYARLRRAFDELSMRGLLVRENYWCCDTCARDAINEEIDEAFDRGEEPRGYVLFHAQDTELVANSGQLLLRYGGVTLDSQAEAAAEAKQIGDEIAAALHRARFDIAWSGSPDDVIRLSIDWDKRPPAETALM